MDRHYIDSLNIKCTSSECSTFVYEVQDYDYFLYYNSFENSLSVQNLTGGELKLFSITGQLILSHTFNNGTKLFLKDVSAGVYIAQLNANNKIQNLKILIH